MFHISAYAGTSVTDLHAGQPVTHIGEGGLGRHVVHDQHAVSLPEVLLGDTSESTIPQLELNSSFR